MVINLPKLNVDLEILLNVSSGASVTIQASFCNNTRGKDIFKKITGSTLKQLSSISLYELKELTKCPEDSDPFYSYEKENLNLILTAFGSTLFVDVGIGVRKRVSDLARDKRMSFLNLFEDFSLNKNEIVSYKFEIDNYDNPIRLTALSIGDSEADIFLSFCKNKTGSLIISLKAEKYEIVFVNSSYLGKIVDDTTCVPNTMLPISRTMYVNVVGVRDNSTGTIEIDVQQDPEGELNSTDSTLIPYLILSHVVSLKQNEKEEFNLTVDDLDSGLNFSISVHVGEISLKIKECENVEVDKFNKSRHFVHLNKSRILDIFNQNEFDRCIKRNISTVMQKEPQKMAFIVQGLYEYNHAQIYVYNGFIDASTLEKDKKGFFALYSTLIIIAASFLAFLCASIAVMVYANYRIKQKHWNRRREAMKFMRSSSEPAVVHPIRNSDNINVFEMSGRNWM